MVTETIGVTKYNEVYNKITCEPGMAYELRDYFTFDVPGAKFTPAYRSKYWDGKIRLYNPLQGLLYAGLLEQLQQFCKSRDVVCEHLSDFSTKEFSVVEAEREIQSYKLPDNLKTYDYQLDTFIHAIRSGRGIYLSPTASGKSLMIYLITRYYASKTLIIVPTTQLVSQLYGDFEDYGFNSSKYVHQIMGGKEKDTNQPIYISTWQSIYKLPKSWFAQFDLIIGDEVHLFKAKSLVTIMTNLEDCKYRFGFTGTLDGSQTNELVLNGLFGPTRKVTSTAQLIKDGRVSDLNIKALVLSYPDSLRKIVTKMDYQQEIDYIVRLSERNNFIKNLALSLKGNTLVIFQFVEKHGEVLYNLIKEELEKTGSHRSLYFISGKVDGEERNDIKQIVETEEDAIIVASSGTFSTGVNIRKLHNMIFTSPSKGRIKNLQSIGRILRLHESKDISTLFDIADDFSWKKSRNFTLNHFVERVKIYAEEGFKYKIYNINLEIKDTISH